MTKCEKCDTWIISGKATCSACTDTLAQMREKVAEHKDPDYQLVKAAFTVLRWLCPPFHSDAYRRAVTNLLSVYNKEAYMRAHNDTWHLVPRKRKEQAK